MYLDELNDSQRLAAMETEGYVRVIAGAGTGKTRVLTSRYLYLVKELGVSPDRILCMTFTRKAMHEMKDRIRKEIGEEALLRYVLTYHSFGSLFLREEIKCLGYSHGFSIYDEDDQRRILKKLYEKEGIELDDNILTDIKDLIHDVKKKEAYIPRMYDRNYENKILDKVDSIDEKIINGYLLSQRKRHWLDFDDLIFYMHYILKTHEDIREKWQNFFSYVEVDEAQDTSTIENEIIEMLSCKCRNLFVVGDPDQNIYEWRDSDNRILLDFDKTHPMCKTFTLEKNYRSTPNIVTGSNRLIKHNVNRIDKNLYAVKEKGSDISYEFVSDSMEEASSIASRIEGEKKEGLNYKDIAILYRCNYQSKPIEEKLREKGIPYHIVGGVSFYSLVEIKDLIALFRLYLFEDDDAFRRMINKPTRRFGKKKLEHLEEIRKEESLYHALLKNRNDIEFIESDVFEFLDNIEHIKKHEEEWGMEKTVNHIFDESGYQDYLMGLKNVSHLENAQYFLNDIKEYARRNPKATLEDYYHHSLEDLDETRKDYDCVYLMTVHAAKGLEFTDVHVIGMNELIFPHKKSISERGDEGLEEERRLFYVAMTRAKDHLYLYSEYENGFNKDCRASRFIKEALPNVKEEPKEKSIEKPKKAKPKTHRSSFKETKPVDVKPKRKKKEKQGYLSSLFDKFTK